MQPDILFDNIYVGHSVADADKLAQETFMIKHPIEKALADAEKPKQEDPKAPFNLSFLDDPVAYIKERLDLFFTIFQQDPIAAIKFVPEAAGGIAAVVVTLIAIVASLISLGSSPAVQQAAVDAKDKAKVVASDAQDKAKVMANDAQNAALDAKDKIADATATGVEKAKAEVNKRSTRSQN